MYTHSKNDTTFKYVYVLKKETTVVDVEVHPPCSDHEDDDVIVISSDDEDDDVTTTISGPETIYVVSKWPKSGHNFKLPQQMVATCR
ncbi:hypothetical protein Tco_1539000 [Tanacetum coccineum]